MGIDEDGDGVEDNVKLDQYALDKFRKMVFSAPVEDLHNTHNGEMPGHHRFGDSPEPGVNPWAIAMAKEKADYEARVAQKKKAQELEAKGFTEFNLILKSLLMKLAQTVSMIKHQSSSFQRLPKRDHMNQERSSMLMAMALRTTSKNHKKSLICSESQCSEKPALIFTTLRMASSLDM